MLFSRRFLPLFACQFFSAFNDNFLKTSLVFLILFGATEDRSALITLASAIFIAPFFFLSALGGEIADRFDKAVVAQRLKFVEIAIAGIAIAGYATGSLVTLFVALAGFGVIAALFGPIKYGILPDHLQREQLPTANALIEAATFIAILTGTIAGGLATKGGGDVIALSALVMVFAVLCWVSALFIPPTGSGAPDLKIRANLAASTAAMLRYLRADPPAVVGLAGDQLVLAGRHCRAVAAAADGEAIGWRRRGYGHPVPGHLLGRGRHRIRPCRLDRARPHRAPDHADRRGPARACSRSISASC